MSCDVYRELVSSYLDESLDEVRRAGFRAHLRSCSGCRDFALAQDSTLVFVLAERTQPAPVEIEACVEAVMAGVRHDRIRRRLRPSRAPWLAAAAAVVLAVTLMGAWWLSPNGEDGAPSMQADALEAPVPGPVATEEPPSHIEPPPRVEVETAEDEVRVYQYAIEDDANTGAVFIVNPAMEL